MSKKLSEKNNNNDIEVGKVRNCTNSYSLSIFGSLIGVVLIVIVSILILSSLNFRLDFTEDKRFTLSEGTKRILKKIDKPLFIRYYFTQSEDMPLILKNYSKRVEDLLSEYKNVNPKFINIEKLNPVEDSDEEDSARVDGIDQLQANTGRSFYLGIALSSGDKKTSIRTLNYTREELLEYDLSKSIFRITEDDKPKVLVVSDIPLVGMPYGQQRVPSWFFYNQLEKDYDVSLKGYEALTIPEDTDVLVVFHPYSIPDKIQYRIDQFLLKGGKVIVLVDPLFYSSIAYNQGQQNPMSVHAAKEKNSDLSFLFKNWGIIYNKDSVIADAVLKTPVSNTVFAPTILTFGADNFSSRDVTTVDLSDLFLLQAGGFGIEEKEGIKYTVLIESSAQSSFVSSFQADISPNSINNLTKSFKSDGKKKAVVVRLEGKFESAFRYNNQVSVATRDKDYIPKSEKDGVVLLISDVDFLFNQFAISQQNILGQQILSYANSNISFFENTLEFMAGGDDLISVRSRVSPRKPFTFIKQREREAEIKYAESIQKLQEEAEKVQNKINSYQNNNNNNNIVLSKEQRDEILKFRESQKEINKELREVRKELRKDIDAVKAIIKGVNILAVPGIIIFLGILYALIKRKNIIAR